MIFTDLTYLNDNEIVNDYITTKSNESANLLIRKYQSLVYNVSFRYLQNKQDTEDVSQDVLIKILNKIDDFKGNSDLSTWIYRVTVNHCKNYLLRKKVRNIFTFSDELDDLHNYPNNEFNAQQKIENEEFKQRFNEALLKLPEKQRETFALRYFEEMPYEEISQLLGTSVGGLKANYFQAVKKLGVLLNEK